MKLTKTQQHLIDLAKKYGGSQSVEVHSGRGSHGGRIRYGSRQRDALNKLVEMGLAIIVARHSDTEFNRGYGIHCTSLVYRLTDKA